MASLRFQTNYLYRLLLIFGILCYFTVPSAAAGDVLNLYFTDFPPFSIREEDGRPAGRLNDYFARMLDIAEINYVVKYYPPRRFSQVVHNGRAPIAITFDNILDKSLYFVSENPVLKLEFNLYWRKDTAPKNSISELQDTKMAVILGYSYGGILSTITDAQNVEIQSLSDSSNSLDMLTTGRVKYLLNYTATMEYNFSSASLNQIQSHHIGSTALYVGIRKNLTDAQKTLFRLEQAYIEVKENGVIDQAFERYIAR